jgi:hypothetical protein
MRPKKGTNVVDKVTKTNAAPLLAIFLMYTMDYAGSLAVGEVTMLTFTEAPLALATIPLRFALAPEGRLTYPAVDPLARADSIFVTAFFGCHFILGAKYALGISPWQLPKPAQQPIRPVSNQGTD